MERSAPITGIDTLAAFAYDGKHDPEHDWQCLLRLLQFDESIVLNMTTQGNSCVIAGVITGALLNRHEPWAAPFIQAMQSRHWPTVRSEVSKILLESTDAIRVNIANYGSMVEGPALEALAGIIPFPIYRPCEMPIMAPDAKLGMLIYAEHAYVIASKAHFDWCAVCDNLAFLDASLLTEDLLVEGRMWKEEAKDALGRELEQLCQPRAAAAALPPMLPQAPRPAQGPRPALARALPPAQAFPPALPQAPRQAQALPPSAATMSSPPSATEPKGRPPHDHPAQTPLSNTLLPMDNPSQTLPAHQLAFIERLIKASEKAQFDKMLKVQAGFMLSDSVELFGVGSSNELSTSELEEINWRINVHYMMTQTASDINLVKDWEVTAVPMRAYKSWQEVVDAKQFLALNAISTAGIVCWSRTEGDEWPSFVQVMNNPAYSMCSHLVIYDVMHETVISYARLCHLYRHLQVVFQWSDKRGIRGHMNTSLFSRPYCILEIGFSFENGLMTWPHYSGLMSLQKIGASLKRVGLLPDEDVDPILPPSNIRENYGWAAWMEWVRRTLHRAISSSHQDKECTVLLEVLLLQMGVDEEEALYEGERLEQGDASLILKSLALCNVWNWGTMCGFTWELWGLQMKLRIGRVGRSNFCIFETNSGGCKVDSRHWEMLMILMMRAIKLGGRLQENQSPISQVADLVSGARILDGLIEAGKNDVAVHLLQDAKAKLMVSEREKTLQAHKE